jgi:hypothetical protein
MYDEEGTFTASVNPQDDGTDVADGSIPVTVADAPISVSVGVPGAIEGQAMNNVVVGTVTDSNLNAPAGDFSGSIDWGDGPNGDDGTDTSTDLTFQPVSGQPGTFNIVATHTYKEEGTFDAVITVNDKGGSYDSNSNTSTVADAPISLSPGNFFAATEGVDTGAITLGTLTDNNPSAPASDFTNNVTIDWGDNTASSQATLVPQGNGIFLVQGDHTYAEEGQNQQITLNATDVGGSTAYPVTVTGNVYDAPISVTPQGAGAIEALPSDVLTVGVLHDTNTTSPDPNDYSGSVTYGDGASTNQLTFVPTGGQNSGNFLIQVPSHLYNDEGNYPMQINVSDFGGSVAPTVLSTCSVAEGTMGVSLQSNVIQGSTDGTQNLDPLTLTTHFEPTASWSLVLSQGDAAKVDVWTMPNPGPSDQPLLGLVNGNIVASTSWASSESVPPTLYVGAYHGSSVVGDILFAFTESEPSTQPTTVISSPATAVMLNTLTATDHSDTSNKVVATQALPTRDLYVAEDPNSLTATVDLAATFDPSNDGAIALWKVEGASAAPASGNFGNANPEITLTPTDGNYDYTIQGGMDTNGDGVLESNEVTRTINVHVFGADIQFNNTPVTSDDLVMLTTPAYGSDIPANQPELDAAVKLLGDAPDGMTVTLDNPDGRLGFGTDAPSLQPTTQPSSPVSTQPTTQPFALPTDGSWLHLPVFGLNQSNDVGDASVRITANIAGRLGGVVLNQKGATVFWFSNANLTITAAGHYAEVTTANFPVPTDTYTVDRTTDPVAVAVRIQGAASITPLGLDPQAPQIEVLRIGFVQNLVSSTRTVVYANPVKIATLNGGGAANVPATLTSTVHVPPNLNDTDSASAPLYEQNQGAIDLSPVVMPNGLNGAANQTAAITDTPATGSFPDTETEYGTDANGTKVGQVKYTLQKLTLADVFSDFLVVGEVGADGKVTTVVAPLLETGWSLNVDSSAADPKTQVAVPNPDANGGSPPTDNPILGGPFFNTELANPANDTESTSANTIPETFN